MQINKNSNVKIWVSIWVSIMDMQHLILKANNLEIFFLEMNIGISLLSKPNNYLIVLMHDTSDFFYTLYMLLYIIW